MIGCVIAAAGAVGVFALIRHRRRCHSYGYAGGCHGGRWRRGDFHEEGPRWERAGMRRHLLRRVFQRLETTPAQERVILETAESIEGAVSRQAEAARGWRGALAQAFDGERFDRGGIDAFFEAQEKALTELKATISGKLAGVHESLEPDQRGEVARMIRNFGGWRHG